MPDTNNNTSTKPEDNKQNTNAPSSQGNSSGVPLYHQWDKRWADHPYGSDGSTVCTSGCGPTSFAMICAWYGKNVTPDMVADDFVQSGHRVLGQGTDHTAFQDRGPSYGVEFKYVNDPAPVREALKAGFPVIAAHGDGLFTGGGHYIVYAKLDNQGLIINDPNQGGSRNKNGDDYHWDLETVLADGGVCDWWIPTTSHDGIKPNFNAQSQAEGGTNPAGGAMNKALGPANNNIADHVGWVEINPKGKTYCEPVYPDFVYVQGNIPNTVVETTAVNGMNNMDQTGDYGIMTSQTMQDLMGINGNAFTTDQAQKLAQRPFDPQNSISEVKVPSAGKPLNNNDPFPVDLKIEELENHAPRVKQYRLPYTRDHMETKELASAILTLSDFTEKRLVKLENVLSTVLRYTFAIGKRMHVNCVYWGGTDHRSKYVCIRCLKDNLLEDGQVMQLDQCLSCSRYEPIIGATYDILNEVGANLANIQDDIQAGMMNMEDYINFLRIEQMHDKKLDYQLNYKTTSTRDQNERPFKDQWDDGVKMGWKLTPVEQQKPQINWRQDINSDDKSPEKLSSYQLANGPGSSGLTPTVSINPGDYKSSIDGHKQFMDDVLAGKYDPKDNSGTGNNSSSNTTGDKKKQEMKIWWPKAKESISAGLSNGKARAEEAVKNLKLNGYEQTLQRIAGENKIDPLLAMAVIAVISNGDPAQGLFGTNSGAIEGQIEAGVKELKKLSEQYTFNGNSIAPVTAYKKWSDGLAKLMSAPMNNDDSSNSSNGNNNSTRMYNWEWRKALEEASSDPEFFPAVVQAYQIIDAANTGLSQLANQEEGMDFPIPTKDLNNVYWIQDFGVANAGSGVGVVSNALVFKCSAEISVHAPEDCDGAGVLSDEAIGKYIKMTSRHSGYTYIFAGLSEDKLSKDANKQNISKGEICATCSDNFILRVQDKNGSFVDPKTVWKLLNSINVSKETSVGKQIEKTNNKGVNPEPVFSEAAEKEKRAQIKQYEKIMDDYTKKADALFAGWESAIQNDPNASGKTWVIQWAAQNRPQEYAQYKEYQQKANEASNKVMQLCMQ